LPAGENFDKNRAYARFLGDIWLIRANIAMIFSFVWYHLNRIIAFDQNVKTRYRFSPNHQNRGKPSPKTSKPVIAFTSIIKTKQYHNKPTITSRETQ